MKTVKFFTLGCKVNQYETQSIRERFLKNGFREVNDKERADFYLINTCTVTAIADQKSRSIIRQCVNSNPKARIIVTGCLVKQDRQELAQLKGVDLIIDKSFFSEGISSFSAHTRAFLKIQDGCDNFCSYCKVPLVRGRSRSRAFDVVIKEAKVLVKSGHQEIVLTGICLGSYGLDLCPKLTLVDLLKELVKISALKRIRLSSIEAKDVTGELITLISASRNICRHLHIPMQSGDDSILKLMHRRDTKKSYIGLIQKIKKKIPGVGITTDVIVGFPGETDQAFNNTLLLLRGVRPLRVHVFPYSPRSGTRAFLMQSRRVGADVIKERAEKARTLANVLSKEGLRGLLGKEVEVLFESKSVQYPGFYEGYTDNYIKVISRARRVAANSIIRLRVKNISGDLLIAGC